MVGRQDRINPEWLAKKQINILYTLLIRSLFSLARFDIQEDQHISDIKLKQLYDKELARRTELRIHRQLPEVSEATKAKFKVNRPAVVNNKQHP